jgi:hypothetical protein
MRYREHSHRLMLPNTSEPWAALYSETPSSNRTNKPLDEALVR